MGLPVQYKFRTDDLHHLAAGSRRQLLCRKACIILNIVFKDTALDELPGLQRIIGLLDEVFADSVLPHMDDGVDGVGQSAKLCPLLACQFHKNPFIGPFPPNIL